MNYSYTSTSHSAMSPYPIIGSFWLIDIAVIILFIVSLWKIFIKADQPGWAAIIPFYNLYILLKIAGRPGWWLILYFIPMVNIFITIFVSLKLAKAFGRSTAFGVVGLWLFSIVGYTMLAFGSSKYIGPNGVAPSTNTPPQPIIPDIAAQPVSPTPLIQ